MKKVALALACLAVLLIAGALYQFIGSSPLATAIIGVKETPKTDLHIFAGRQLYSLRLSAKIGADYQGDARLQLIGDLPAELTLINIGPLLNPSRSSGYSLQDQKLLNLKEGDQLELLVLLRSTGAPLAVDPAVAEAIPACCQLPGDAKGDGSKSPSGPALVLLDSAKNRKLWTIPLRIDVSDSKT